MFAFVMSIALTLIGLAILAAAVYLLWGVFLYLHLKQKERAMTHRRAIAILNCTTQHHTH